MLERKIIKTGDGSVTINIPHWNEQYHSKHGAIQEARHVFLEMGLQYVLDNYKTEPLNILEIGFGTGLNALLTFQMADAEKVQINYTGVEAYPIKPEELNALNYPEASGYKENARLFETMHSLPWEEKLELTPNFKLIKQQKKFEEIEDTSKYNIIYFDAFGARVQPHLWTEEIFAKMYHALMKNGVLVTYSAKGSVRRAMQSIGFKVERLPGPPGKREMLRAVKV